VQQIDFLSLFHDGSAFDSIGFINSYMNCTWLIVVNSSCLL
jgi:hypothetical protein